MFTGLIEDVGVVASIRRLGEDWQVTIATDLDLALVAVGASVAVNGACLTVIAKGAGTFTVEVSSETLRRLHGRSLSEGGRVNLERALSLSGRLDGHLVAGHVDGEGLVERLAAKGRSREIWFRVSDALGKYIVAKGSVTVDGVSLTVNQVEDAAGVTRFSVNIIRHTEQRTTLGDLSAGSAVNIETDLVARYVERLLRAGGGAVSRGEAAGQRGDDALLSCLQANGFV